ncbi:MAG: PD40 domain-containing protein [Bacteroidales bacterium]|nr:PD40 domain-containing protein [Bacteroidales bacterium]
MNGKTRKVVMLVCVSMVFHLPLFSFHSLQAQYKVTHLEKPYNTSGSETGALQLGDTVLVYSAMPPKVSKGSTFDYSDALMQLYQVRIAKSGKLARPKPCRWGFNGKRDHTGNLAIDPANRDAYFTRGDVETLRCDIWWARGLKRRGWEKPQRLRGPVNDKQYTATHPAVGRLDDTTAILYFVSDRPGGMGGMDIWYALVRDGVASEPVNLGPQVNSASDEMTPFYDQLNGVLYFSSDRAGGKGGFDIYCAVGGRNTWQQAEAVCGCLNSEQNDLYFTIAAHDAASGIPIAGYLSSNRKDSYFLSDSMCCNDLYKWVVDSGQWVAPEPPAPDTLPTTHYPLPTTHFPLPLYFHNDDPDPGSHDTATAADYADCQLRYALLRSQYMAHQPTAADSAAMQQFFDSCVVGHYDRMLGLLEHLRQVLADGRRVELTVTGYASPLHTDRYNHALSQRRIGSLENMIRAWRGGTLAAALDDGRLRIVQQPMGIDKSRPSSTDPVYSLSAAMARRIEVVGCEIF